MKLRIKYFLIGIFALLFFSSMSESSVASASPKALFTTKDYVQAIHEISEVMIHDVVSPPGASRYYGYCTMVGYEIMAQQHSDQFRDLKNILNSFPDLSSAMSSKKIDESFAIIYATLRMGEELIPSGPMLDSVKKIISEKAKKKLKSDVFQNSVDYSEAIVKGIVQYAAADHYREINTMVKYTPKKEIGSWVPTPPAYMQALDPHWDKIRPFTLDSAAQFKPAAMMAYSEDSTSNFFQLAKEVYRVGKNPTQEQKTIANFWDCNPFAVQQNGHIDYGIKKISPGGHWMNITGLACEQEKFPLSKTVQAHAIVAIAIADAFICCWEEKYRSNRIRPETFINQKIDRDWRPLLQTPPFPEYPSGHSDVSNAAATILTKLVGDHFAFTDVTEKEFDQPDRSFKSFNDAASEATISRLYGGIHFRDAIENGATQGKEVGAWVMKKFGLE
ncbi:MAG: vanadium-dependent haloperoxidase [Chitinophagales bacterium]